METLSIDLIDIDLFVQTSNWNFHAQTNKMPIKTQIHFIHLNIFHWCETFLTIQLCGDAFESNKYLRIKWKFLLLFFSFYFHQCVCVYVRRFGAEAKLRTNVNIVWHEFLWMNYVVILIHTRANCLRNSRKSSEFDAFQTFE